MLLALLLAGWIGMRALIWEPPFSFAAMASEGKTKAERPQAPTLAPPSAASLPPAEAMNPAPSRYEPAVPPAPAPLWSDEPLAPARAAPIVEPPADPFSDLPPAAARPARPAGTTEQPRVAAAHSMMLMAAFSSMELPPELAALFPARTSGPAPVPTPIPYAPGALPLGAAIDDRWSADAWVLLRRDTVTAQTSGRGSYGASQLGAVLRYSLAPSSRHAPALYLRASQALTGASETQGAIGLSARPIPGLPLLAAAEMRLTAVAGTTRSAPAAYLVTQLPAFSLPLGLRGEAYAQAGWVGGSQSTGFVDGQLRIDRSVAQMGKAELRAGAGLWGGAQKGAARLDLGPGASINFDLGQAPSRLSLDWRMRVAGDAQPSSGPALTISAGF